MPHIGSSVDRRNELFQRLKKTCVAVAQAAGSLQSGHTNQQHIVSHLEALKDVLYSATSDQPDALDHKLAEYVFFPIAQLLKESRQLSIRCLELCLQCIALLVEKGWKENLPPQLAVQIAILCSTLGEKKPKGLSFSETTDELQSWSFWCLCHVFTVSGESDEARRLFTSESNFPQLGHMISVLLDGIEGANSIGPQIAGTKALEALVRHVLDAEIQANFLPGIVSKLTKILVPKSSHRRNPKVLVGSLDTFTLLIENTLDGSQVKSQQIDDHIVKSGQRKSIIDAEWQAAAATQLKPAITNILRLKTHSRDDVKMSLARLCIMLLSCCRSTLPNCSSVALEALIVILAEPADDVITNQTQFLIRSDRSVTVLLQSMLYDWLQSLPTVMQGADEQAKAMRTDQITVAYKLLVGNGADMTTIDRTLAVALRDSAIVTLACGKGSQETVSTLSPIQSLNATVLSDHSNSTFANSPIARQRGQQSDLRRLESIVNLAMSYHASPEFNTELVKNLHHASGDTQIANFWLLLTAAETATNHAQTIDAFLNLGNNGTGTGSERLEDIYSFSLSVLTTSSDEPQDPRLLALALRGLALRAQTAGEDFRYELVDALYPVLHTLATPDEQLQRDSITTLNVFTSACGYASTKDLITDNVDYLTNAVALKLNAFEVSPQAPQVLLMMVRLAGPSLLPYLEDTVDSIFAALEDYHGYPLLVELLFKVLAGMAEEGVKAPQLAITDRSSQTLAVHRVESWHPTTIVGLAALLQQNAKHRGDHIELHHNHEPHPQRPCKGTEMASDNDDTQEIPEDAVDAVLEQQRDESDAPPPVPRTYNLLLKITELTQHFLPSASPSLRTSLLSLIKTTVPAIARHENSFLPLINTLWPEIVSRLDDDEPYTVASAVEVVGLLCEYAGDFMRTRIDQVWPRLLELSEFKKPSGKSAGSAKTLDHTSLERNGTALTSSNLPGQNVSRSDATRLVQGDTSGMLTSTAIIYVAIRIVQFVQISAEMFDEVLGIVEEALDQPAVREALEASNADALWLAEIKAGLIVLPDVPSAPEEYGWQYARPPS